MIQQNSKDKCLDFLLTCLGITIQQSIVIIGLNISFSDVILLLLCFSLIKNQRKLMVGKRIILFFILLLLYRLIVTFILSSMEPYVSIKVYDIILSILKMGTTFFYFLIGYNFIHHKKEVKVFFTAYGIFSMIVSLICIVGSITNASVIKDYFFFDDVRAQGLMNDPNYFGLTQLITFCMSLFLIKKQSVKWLSMIIAIGGIIVSGSKTSFIILILLIGITFYVKFVEIPFVNYFSISIFMIVVILVSSIIISFYRIDLDVFDGFPALKRMLSIFSEGANAIDKNGSNRSVVWENGIRIIQDTHGFGIGLNNYSNHSFAVNHIHEVVHNTYLQIMAEWGIIFAFALFAYLIYLFVLIFKENNDAILSFLVATFFIMLVYSFAVSLNNSRFIALSLGMVAVYVQNGRKERSADHET